MVRCLGLLRALGADARLVGGGGAPVAPERVRDYANRSGTNLLRSPVQLETWTTALTASGRTAGRQTTAASARLFFLAHLASGVSPVRLTIGTP